MISGAILRVKKIIAKLNGDTLVDLISSTFSFERTSTFTEGMTRVKEDEAMRPDLVSMRMYSKENYYDVILKYNGISNPFSLAPGEILAIPPFKEFERMIVPPREIPEKGKELMSNSEDRLLNPKTLKDKKRLESLKTSTREIVPPNVNTKGNTNVKVKDGRVVFGEDVTQINKDNCKIPISRARLIQQLTKANLF